MRWVAVVAVVVACVGSARADKIGVPPVHAEADVASDAAAVTMLVRAALDRSKDTLVDVPAGAGLSSAAKLDVDRIVFVELSREGTGLRATLATAGRDGSVEVTFVRAGDGDVFAIASGIAEHLHVPFVPPVGGAALSPFVAAKTDPDMLVVAQPSVAIAVPAAKEGLAPPADRVSAIIVARALGDGKALEALATGKDPTAVAAKAFAAMARADIKGAEAALGKQPPKHALIALAQAVIAEHRGDDKKLGEAIKAALDNGPAGRAAVAFAASVAPERLSKDLLKQLLDRAEKEPPAIASRIGLAAAEQNVDAGRALALVRVHDLDDADLARLERIVAGGASAAIPRLRAELAMRRANGTERKMIDAYLAAAPADPRAKLYGAWQLRHDHEEAKAAAQLDGLDKARALAAAGDLRAALAAIGGKTDTPEQQAIAARVALLDHLDTQASKLVDLAEGAAPANPFVQRAVLDVATEKKDDKRIAIARRFKVEDDLHLATTGTGVQIKDLGSNGKATSTETGKQITVDISPDLATLLVGLPGLPPSHHRLALVEQRYKTPLFSLRVANPDAVRAALAAVLAKPPLELDVEIDSKPLDDDLTTSSLSARLGGAEALLIYKVAPISDGAMVTLTIYQRNGTKVDEISGPVEMPEASRLDITKVVVLVLVGIILVGLIGWRVAGGRGHIKIRIETPPDATDSVYAVDVTKSPVRPTGVFDHKRMTEMKKVGAIVKARSATLIENGFEMKLPVGKWHVHLTGGFFRGGALRPVPDVATKQIEVTRGGVHDVVFDLVPTHAELDIVVESATGRISIWLDDDSRHTRYLDGNGRITMPIALGSHVIHLQVGLDKHIKRSVHVSVPRIERVAINVARELRIAGEGFRLDTGEPVAKIELDDQTFDNETVMGGAATMVVATEPKLATDTKLLDRYRIVGQLGRGAMGIVHRAWDERLERDVAIKEMAPELLDNPDMLDMFSREAKSLAQINHPNIVGIYDQITTGERILMIMEFVDGTTLDAVLKKRGKVPWQDAIHVIDQVCAGLAYVHQRKIIHRDIKPANIFIGRDRGVKLGDFGLAKVAHETKIRRTETRGTPLYMAPEQVTGKNVDHRADLYAVGCTLFELVCGRPPFIQGEIMWQQVYEAPPEPSTLVDLPDSLDRLILALIAKSPDERPATANDVRSGFRKL